MKQIFEGLLGVLLLALSASGQTETPVADAVGKPASAAAEPSVPAAEADKPASAVVESPPPPSAEPAAAAAVATDTAATAASPAPAVDSAQPVPVASPAASVQANPAEENMPPPPSADIDTGEELDSDFLLPAAGEVFYEPDLKVLASLPAKPPAAIALVVDGYTEKTPVTVENGLISIRLQDLKSGVHELALLFFNDRSEITARIETRFFIRLPEPAKTSHKNDYRQFGRVMAKADWKGGEAQGRILNQSALKASVVKTPSGADSIASLKAGSKVKPLSQEVEALTEAAYNVKYKQLQAFAKVLLRTDENGFRQPSDRFAANAKYGPWVAVKGGDVYPSYNDLVLNGTRVRGGEASLNLIVKEKQYGSLKVVRGESRRAVPAYIAEYDTGGGTRVDTVPGTFAQELTAARLGFGGGTHFELGFTFLKVTDKFGSLSEMMLNDSLRGARPVENLVPGVDLRVGIWDSRIQFYAEGATSIFTRDASLGPLSADSFGIAIDPADYKGLITFNSTTRGWQYLVSNNTDYGGFLGSISAYNAGTVLSFPIPGIVTTETELRYSHLGLEYHSEGNPFLGGNPGDGITFIQKALVLNNRLSLGMELGNYQQDLGITSQIQRDLKGEVRLTPGPNQPSFWIGGGRTNTAPDGNYSHQFSSSFWNLNTGAYHQFQLPEGRLHASVIYGFTQSEFSLVPDTTFPSTRTNIVSASTQYKPRFSSFVPRMAYTFAHNGIQKPTNSITLGAIQGFAQNRIKLDLSTTVSQYPKSLTKNDLSLGETANLEYILARNQTVRLRERWVQYGSRKNVIAGANYELFF